MDMTSRLTLPLLNRRVGHWRPRYLWSRFRRWYYDSTHRGSPWLTRQAIALLEQLIAREDVGFEWGAGRSTLWFAQRCGRLWSVEHDPSWHSSVSAALRQARRDNVTLLLRERKPPWRPNMLVPSSSSRTSPLTLFWWTARTGTAAPSMQ